MDNQKIKFFLLIGLKKIKLSALNENNKILLEKQIFVDDFSLDKNFKTLDEFLNQNIFYFEKKLNNHLKEINLIVESFIRNNKLIPDIATIDATNFSFKPLKSTFPIQAGLSSLSLAAPILETKFS